MSAKNSDVMPKRGRKHREDQPLSPRMRHLGRLGVRTISGWHHFGQRRHRIGAKIAEAMKKVGNEGVITVEESKSLETELDVVEGMQFDRGYLSPYFITNADKMIAALEDPHILIHEKKLSNLQALLPHLEAVVQSGKPLLIDESALTGEPIPVTRQDERPPKAEASPAAPAAAHR